jgi:hypothetical protein
VKLRELLKKIDLSLRPPHVQGHVVEQSVDNVDALSTMSPLGGDPMESGGPASAPPNWVPSQQDERPRH